MTVGAKTKNYSIKSAFDRPVKFLKKPDWAEQIARLYGFQPLGNLEPLANLPALKDLGGVFCRSNLEQQWFCHQLEEKRRLLHFYEQSQLKSMPLPLSLSYRRAQKIGRRLESSLNLAVLGTLSSVAEALCFKTALTLFQETGQVENLKIEINCVGERDSFNRFEKDFFCYLRKNLERLPPAVNKTAAEDLWSILDWDGPEAADFWHNAPKSLNYLSTSSIKHFQEVLEYLEMFKITYILNHRLIPNKQYCHQTVFQIGDQAGEVLALGVRHINLAKKLGLKMDLPFLLLSLKDRLIGRRKASAEQPPARFFLVQFGFKARMKSLALIDLLRQSGIPLAHDLTKDKLLDQLLVAEKGGFSHLLIIGEKEAVENTVAVRNLETRVQEVVPLAGLPGYLKKLKTKFDRVRLSATI